ncbi:hypothetical protein OS493_020418 [Desmophyllum pertusum]|uniref:Uncharacterized protein n=1 Tax=Desmophyllum pertusum TaxID=174260 RepID=A0A9W9ZCI0_9CNID|nr:hypothetical protein OS493_020418 [Desmophyllum pertusum]
MVKRSVTLFHRYTPVIKWRNSMMTTYKTLLVSLPVLPKTSDNNQWNGPGKTQPSSLQHEHEDGLCEPLIETNICACFHTEESDKKKIREENIAKSSSTNFPLASMWH